MASKAPLYLPRWPWQHWYPVLSWPVQAIAPDNKTIGASLAIAGPAVGVVFGLIGFKNYKIHSKKAEKVKNELQRRNQPLTTFSITPRVDPFNKSAQLGLRLTF